MIYDKSSSAIELSVRELCNMAYKSGSLGSYYDLDVSVSDRLDSDRLAEIVEANPDFVLYREEELTAMQTHRELLFKLFDCAFVKYSHISKTLCINKILAVRGYEMPSLYSERTQARLKLLAYLASKNYESEYVCAKMTYINTDNGKLREVEEQYTSDYLKAFFEESIDKIYFFASLLEKRVNTSLASIKEAKFPYDTVRQGQREMIQKVYTSVAKGRRFIVQAPTGTGKTISSLYPSVKAIGDSFADKVFYLTAKASTRKEAYSACAKLYGAGAKIRSITLYAKDQFCKKEDAICKHCDAEHCEYARGYYDRVDIALREIISSQNGYNRTAIENVAEKYKICPYEFSLDLSRYCDVVICDYNYVFDPSVYLKRYFAPDAPKSQYVFLVDEAHNLSDRARDMYSAEVSLESIANLYSYLSSEEKLGADFEELIKLMYSMKKLCQDNLSKNSDGEYTGFYIDKSPLENFNSKLLSLSRATQRWLKVNRENEFADTIDALFGDIKKYLCILEYYDEHFLSYYEIVNNRVKIKILCLDASDILNRRMMLARSSVLFSATLTPMDYFSDILGVGRSAAKLQISSPFDTDNLGVFVVDCISTRYDDRARSYSKIVSCIAATVSSRIGNYIVYFPSYSYMQEVVKRFSAKYPAVSITVQKKGMTHAEKEKFLDSFKSDTGKLRVGFCVLGGSFSEGVDLPGSRLIGSIIVGVGIPGLSNDRNILRDYFENKCESGYDYAYTFPGMNNVLQAAGRVIRTESDKGVIVLIDDRYAEPKYTEIFPAHWKNIKYAKSPTLLAELAADFWKNV